MACESYILTTFHRFCILLTTEVVSKILPYLNVVAHLVVPAGWGSCLPRLTIFCLYCHHICRKGLSLMDTTCQKFENHQNSSKTQKYISMQLVKTSKVNKKQI